MIRSLLSRVPPFERSDRTLAAEEASEAGSGRVPALAPACPSTPCSATACSISARTFSVDRCRACSARSRSPWIAARMSSIWLCSFTRRSFAPPKGRSSLSRKAQRRRSRGSGDAPRQKHDEAAPCSSSSTGSAHGWRTVALEQAVAVRRGRSDPSVGGRLGRRLAAVGCERHLVEQRDHALDQLGEPVERRQQDRRRHPPPATPRPRRARRAPSAAPCLTAGTLPTRPARRRADVDSFRRSHSATWFHPSTTIRSHFWRARASESANGDRAGTPAKRRSGRRGG